MKVPCKYNPGDKIFAKVKGFVYWPARVNPLPDDIAIPPNKIPIFFYGTHEVFFIAPTSCWPFDEKNKSKWGKPRSRAHFNQGMDEIENHSTIYQYGADPLAEDFLSQFYEFKRSDGQSAKPKESVKSEKIEDEEEIDKEVVKKPSKKRNKSGSSASTKENKNNSKCSDKDCAVDMKLEVSEIKDESTSPVRKRRISESALSAKENTTSDLINDESVSADEPSEMDMSDRKRKKSESSITAKSRKSTSKSKPTPDIREAKQEKILDDNVRVDVSIDVTKPEETSEDIAMVKEEEEEECDIRQLASTIDDLGDSIKPKTRYRAKSSSTKTSNNQSVLSDNKSFHDSDSTSVESDNLADEDFRPATGSSVTKAKRFAKKAKTPRQPKSVTKKSTPAPARKKLPQKSKSVVKKMKEKTVDSEDSLSSISSIEDFKTKIDNQKKEYEEKLKLIQMQQLEREKTAVKEASKRTKAKRISESLTTTDNEVVDTLLKEEKSEPDEPVIGAGEDLRPVDDETIDCKLDKEIVVNLYKTDIINDTNDVKQIDKFDSQSSPEINNLPHKINIPNINGVNHPDDNNPVVEYELNAASVQPADESNSDRIKPVDKPSRQRAPSAVEKIKKVKINLKEMKINKKSSKPTPATNNRKRNRKISSSSDSDVGLVDMKVKESEPKSKKTKIIDRVNIEPYEKPVKSVDILQILQNFNADIRSSLVLGHEDYTICLDRFRSLCDMEIDFLSLVKVWQLMDTVKKCRRYKRNEQVKQNAQAVYKHFMDIYSRASKEDISTAQSLLSQYHHQNNAHTANTNKANGQALPFSVADMFQQHKTQTTASCENINTATSLQGPSPPPPAVVAEEPPLNQHTEEEINDEKMRLLMVDLEAKVSDILNKIEKNVEPNPINQRSLSHLLPSADEHPAIKLPTQWRTVGDTNHLDKDKIVDDMSDEDEEDVEAVVRRIEEVAIKINEPELPMLPDFNIMNGNSSALDVRIENLINSSFISTKDSHQRKSKSSSSRHHKSQKASSPRTTSHPPKSDSTDQLIRPADISLPLTNSNVPEPSVTTTNVTQPEEQKDDIEIYDLLGV